MKRKISLYVRDMLDNMDKAESFTQGLDFPRFTNDEKTQYAVVRSIEIIGEAAKHVPDEVRLRYSHIPWRDMSGMRDKVIHLYFGVNAQKVWLVITEDIPRLKPLLQDVLHDLERQ